MTRAGVVTALLVVLVLPVVLVGAVAGALGPGVGSGLGGWTELALADIPPGYRLLYEQATTECPTLPPAILAAIGKVESDHGRSAAPGVTGGLNSAGCCAGPMQFNLTDGPPSTWASYARPGDSVYDPADAIPAAARKLCADGLDQPTVQGRDPCPTAPGAVALHRALWAYNHACAYVRAVIAQAVAYSPAALVASPVSGMLAALGDARALLANPNVRLSPNARADLEAGRIDPRVVAVLAALGERYPPVSVSVLQTGHSLYVAGTDTRSLHSFGRAADVFALGGQPVTRANPAAREAVAWLAELAGPLRPAEVGSPFAEFAPIPGWFTDLAHHDHLHLGYESVLPGQMP